MSTRYIVMAMLLDFAENWKHGFKAYYKLSKISKNSLISCLRKENQRHEVDISFLNYRSFSWWTRMQIHARLHNICFASLKLVWHSIIKCLHSCKKLQSKHSIHCLCLMPFWEESAHCHFGKVAFMHKISSWALHLFSSDHTQPITQKKLV